MCGLDTLVLAEFRDPQTSECRKPGRARVLLVPIQGMKKELWRLQPLRVRGQMNRVGISVTLLLLLMSLASCNKAPTQPASQVSSNAKRYHLKGKVVSIDKQSKMANIDSEAIPDFMDAMTMPYNLKPESDLDKLKPGDAITADVVVQDEKAWLENIAVTGAASNEKK